MAELSFNIHAPKWHLAYFVPIDGHFGSKFWDMDFTFVMPIIYINFDIQTNLSETFKIDVNMNFANTGWGRFLI